MNLKDTRIVKKMSRIIFGFLLIFSSASFAERIKDIANIDGVRENQLTGYGLVVGLNGTGDKTNFSEQSLVSMLKKFGINVPAGVKTNAKNIAAVAVVANLKSFAKPGQKIDITVSSLGNSKSLRGGTLLVTPLKGINGKIYAVAQGNLIVGGLDATGKDGSKVTVNVPSVGRIPNGAIIEREVPNAFASKPYIRLNLKNSDFTTASNMVESINDLLGEGTAKALDSETIEVQAPSSPDKKVKYLSVIENIEVKTGEAAAKVIINSRTGTVVINQAVRVKPAAITHGGIMLKIDENDGVEQPNPLAQGQTAGVANSDVSVKEDNSRMFEFKEGVNLNDIVNAINKVGVAPSDLVIILEALRQADALKAELIVI
jgi:flagellar P-ring protein precursor FlgI